MLVVFERLVGESAEKARYLSFLRDEFKENGYLTSDPFGLNELLLRELVETIFEPSFEGRAPTHGAIICSHAFDQYQQNLSRGTWMPGINEDGRIFCDGTKTFRVICPNGQGVFSFAEGFVLDELDLFTIRDDALFVHGGEDHEHPLRKDMFLLKKSAGGEIIILSREGIAVHREARLSFFKYQYYFKGILREFLDSKWTDNPWHNQVLDSILRLSIHILGAERGVGGTIVLLHPDDLVDDGKLNVANVITLPVDMNVTQRDHQHLLVSLMKNVDGAILIDSEGRLRTARNWLVLPNDLMTAGESEGGTRHLTARLFSQLIKGLVFVISSDGPVTLYSDGAQVFRTCDRR